MSATIRWLSALAVLLGLLSARPIQADEKKCGGAKEIKVTVLAILATDQNKEIEKELAAIAKEVQKKEPSLTGFKIHRTGNKSVKIGQKANFQLVEGAELVVLLKEEADHRVSINLKPPTVGKISYSCCCGKYFPVVTRYLTKDGRRLIVAVMVKPCNGKK